MGLIDGAEFGPPVVTKDKGIHQATWPGNDGGPTTGSPKGRNSLPLTGSKIDFLFQSGGTTNNDKWHVGFPEAYKFHTIRLRFGPVQQGLVEGQIFGWGIK